MGDPRVKTDEHLLRDLESLWLEKRPNSWEESEFWCHLDELLLRIRAGALELE